MPREIHYNAAEHISAASAADPYARPAFSIGNRITRLLWNITWAILYRLSPRPFFAWRALLLRIFGAKLGPTCKFYPSSRVWAPWNLSCADLVDRLRRSSAQVVEQPVVGRDLRAQLARVWFRHRRQPTPVQGRVDISTVPSRSDPAFPLPFVA